MIPTPEQFKKATPLDVTIVDSNDDHSITVDPKVFSTGSLGWYAQDKITVNIPGLGKVEAKVNIQVIIPGTKK